MFFKNNIFKNYDFQTKYLVSFFISHHLLPLYYIQKANKNKITFIYYSLNKLDRVSTFKPLLYILSIIWFNSASTIPLIGKEIIDPL